jgi:hypothetical protein
MQGAQRHQVDLMAEQAGQLLGELLDLPAQLAPRAQCVQDVDIAIGTCITASPGREHLQLGDPVPVADGGQRRVVDLDIRSDPHDPRLSPAARAAAADLRTRAPPPIAA